MNKKSITNGILIGKKYASRKYTIDVLEELVSKINEVADFEADRTFAQGELFCRDLIQEKIDKLKESD